MMGFDATWDGLAGRWKNAGITTWEPWSHTDFWVTTHRDLTTGRTRGERMSPAENLPGWSAQEGTLGTPTGFPTEALMRMDKSLQNQHNCTCKRFFFFSAS